MGRFFISIICGLCIAVFVSYMQADNGFDNLRFKLGLYDPANEEKAIEVTLNLFNRNFATLFNTGGDVSAALNTFPAANLIKRRVVQEINDWAKNNRVLVYDKDVFELLNVDILSPGRAVAIAREVWFLNVQNRETRREKSGVKASPIKVRYLLKKIEKRWIVLEYEVFGRDDDIPPIKSERIWL